MRTMDILKKCIFIHDQLNRYKNVSIINEVIKEDYFDDYKNRANGFFKNSNSTDFISKLSLYSLFIINEDFSFINDMDNLIKNNNGCSIKFNFIDEIMKLEMSSVDDGIRAYQLAIIACLVYDESKSDKALELCDRRLMKLI